MQLLESVLMNSGVPFDVQKGAKRNIQIIDDFLQLKVNQVDATAKEE